MQVISLAAYLWALQCASAPISVDGASGQATVLMNVELPHHCNANEQLPQVLRNISHS